MPLVRLTVANTPFDADMIQSLLRTEGIDSTRRQTNFGAGSSDGWGGQQEVLIEETDLEAARALISQDAK